MKATSNPESEAIRGRFFAALEQIKASGKGSSYEFALKHGIDLSNMMKLKKNERQPIPGWYLAALVTDYNVTAEWLLLGTGPIFSD